MGENQSSLKCILPGLKKMRREPLSPTSVGDVHVPTAQLTTSVCLTRAGSPAPAVSASAAGKVQSVVRGLQHLSACRNGCKNPLCNSTRSFVDKVSTHMATMAQKKEHDAAKCGACKLWKGIVEHHAGSCKAEDCSVPMCADKKMARANGSSSL